MIPPQDPITTQFPATAPTIDAALVLLRLAAGARGHPGSPFLTAAAVSGTNPQPQCRDCDRKFAPAPRRVHREPTAPRLLDQSRR